jgi:hypothetical protein
MNAATATDRRELTSWSIARQGATLAVVAACAQHTHHLAAQSPWRDAAHVVSADGHLRQIALRGGPPAGVGPSAGRLPAARC